MLSMSRRKVRRPKIGWNNDTIVQKFGQMIRGHVKELIGKSPETYDALVSSARCCQGDTQNKNKKATKNNKNNNNYSALLEPEGGGGDVWSSKNIMKYL